MYICTAKSNRFNILTNEQISFPLCLEESYIAILVSSKRKVHILIVFSFAKEIDGSSDNTSVTCRCVKLNVWACCGVKCCTERNRNHNNGEVAGCP